MTYTAHDLLLKIEANHVAPDWACFAEVSNGTGGNARRRSDALAMSLWPSRGLIMRGFEIKVRRDDWRNEKRNPMKAEEIGQFCHEWWVVAAPGVVDDPETEMPPAWGLMVPDDAGVLRVVHKATALDPRPITRQFLAAVLRAADKAKAAHNEGWIRRSEIAEQVRLAEERGAARVTHEAKLAKRNMENLQKRMTEFRDACGIDLLGDGAHDWSVDAGRMGDAMRIGLAILGNGRQWEALLATSVGVAKQAEEFRDRLMAAAKALATKG